MNVETYREHHPEASLQDRLWYIADDAYAFLHYQDVLKPESRAEFNALALVPKPFSNVSRR